MKYKACFACHGDCDPFGGTGGHVGDCSLCDGWGEVPEEMCEMCGLMYCEHQPTGPSTASNGESREAAEVCC